ncbi:hypothetical protein LOD99_10140 [Oopsacas minuta]|uniref:Uncharacterized protein n=1 Tax=Oopsacas minuta TaxID=111878 RepID=A0AAV7KII6_9METZ|nr:hypothetical protein LOD99_10140 [Oopsacas minuta]
MDLETCLANIFNLIEGLESITIYDTQSYELLTQKSPTSKNQSLPPPKTSLAEVFIRQCQHAQLLMSNEQQAAPPRLETLVTYFKTRQVLQLSFQFDNEYLVFNVVAKITAKTAIIIDLFRKDIIPKIQNAI